MLNNNGIWDERITPEDEENDVPTYQDGTPVPQEDIDEYEFELKGGVYEY